MKSPGRSGGLQDSDLRDVERNHIKDLAQPRSSANCGSLRRMRRHIVFEGTWLDVRRHLQTTVTEVKELALKMDGGVSGFWAGPVNRRSTGVQPALHRKMLQVLVRKTSESFSWNLCCESLFTFFSLLTPALICSYSLHDKIRADCNLGQVLKLGNT